LLPGRCDLHEAATPPTPVSTAGFLRESSGMSIAPFEDSLEDIFGRRIENGREEIRKAEI
jgi:hypothetical protein